MFLSWNIADFAWNERESVSLSFWQISCREEIRTRRCLRLENDLFLKTQPLRKEQKIEISAVPTLIPPPPALTKRGKGILSLWPLSLSSRLYMITHHWYHCYSTRTNVSAYISNSVTLPFAGNIDAECGPSHVLQLRNGQRSVLTATIQKKYNTESR